MISRKLSIVIVLAALSALVFAGCYRTPEQRAENIVKHISESLQLNADQQAKLEKIKNEFMTKRLEMGKSREAAYEEANALMKSDQIDQARLNALIEKNQTETTELVRFIFAKFAEIHDMLTPEQRAKLVADMEKFKEKGGHHRW